MLEQQWVKLLLKFLDVPGSTPSHCKARTQARDCAFRCMYHQDKSERWKPLEIRKQGEFFFFHQEIAKRSALGLCILCGSRCSWACDNPKSLLPLYQLLIIFKTFWRLFKRNLWALFFSLPRLTIVLASDDRPLDRTEETPNLAAWATFLLSKLMDTWTHSALFYLLSACGISEVIFTTSLSAASSAVSLGWVVVLPPW